MLDEQTGERPGFHTQTDRQHTPSAYFGADKHPGIREGFNDSGGASRFFYVPKADREERNRGLEHHAGRSKTAQYGDGLNSATKVRTEEQERSGVDRGTAANHHPTVKPVALMQWLCRLITPPKGTILDPFCGSGSTGIAALREGFEFIGIEREPEYVEIARDRILGDAPLFNLETVPTRSEEL